MTIQAALVRIVGASCGIPIGATGAGLGAYGLLEMFEEFGWYAFIIPEIPLIALVIVLAGCALAGFSSYVIATTMWQWPRAISIIIGPKGWHVERPHHAHGKSLREADPNLTYYESNWLEQQIKMRGL